MTASPNGVMERSGPGPNEEVLLALWAAACVVDVVIVNVLCDVLEGRWLEVRGLDE